MRQVAPYPAPLRELLDDLHYTPPGRTWTFALEDTERGQGSGGLTLVINIAGPDTHDPGHFVSVNHYMIVPPAAYNRQSWQAWLFDQIGLVELHERMEFFRIGGHRPLAPNHGPGWDPYLVTTLASDTDRRTSFRGELNPESP